MQRTNHLTSFAVCFGTVTFDTVSGLVRRLVPGRLTSRQLPRTIVVVGILFAVVELHTVYASVHLLPSVRLIDAAVMVPGKKIFCEVKSGSVMVLSPLLCFEEHPCTSDTSNERKYGWTRDSLVSLNTEAVEVTIKSCLDYPNGVGQGSLLGIPVAYENLAEKREDLDTEGTDMRYMSEQPWLVVHGILVMRK